MKPLNQANNFFHNLGEGLRNNEL